MNCHHARQLISPYLDHQLTGREMLALQDHFAVCFSCQREMHSIRQVKALLRGLQEPKPPRDFSTVVALRLEQAEAGSLGWRVLCLPAPKPQRGRRLATALALSCLTVVSFVAPFAPEARDATRTSSAFFGSDFSSGSAAFASPAPSDAILSGRMPERISLIPAGDLTHLPTAETSVMPRSDTPILTGLDMQPDLAMTPRSEDVSFGSVQFAALRSR